MVPPADGIPTTLTRNMANLWPLLMTHAYANMTKRTHTRTRTRIHTDRRRHAVNFIDNPICIKAHWRNAWRADGLAPSRMWPQSLSCAVSVHSMCDTKIERERWTP